jgi:hypothetical protein
LPNRPIVFFFSFFTHRVTKKYFWRFWAAKRTDFRIYIAAQTTARSHTVSITK